MYAVIDRNTPAGTSLAPDLYPEGFVMVMDKPYRWTSADAVRKIKFSLRKMYHLHNVKVGHAGTLDPLATGVLLVCVGKATKVSEALQSERKDMEHEVDARYPWEHITEEAISDALKSMEGEQMQLPPIYSAKYVDGIRAYEMARQGEAVELKAARINIYSARLIEYSAPVLKVAVQCSKGTYIRAFARDLGMVLGSGAHLSGLVRTASGGFSISNTLTMDDFLQRF